MPRARLAKRAPCLIRRSRGYPSMDAAPTQLFRSRDLRVSERSRERWLQRQPRGRADTGEVR